jgi:homoserine dehydrogenase
MTTLVDAQSRTRQAIAASPGQRVQPRIALLGFGRIGTAVADELARQQLPGHGRARITGALVRGLTSATRRNPFPLVTDAADLLEAAPDVVIEVLGGLEPARTLVLQALGRGIPVVTANKALLAAHGDELFAAARRFDTPLRFEAAVLAGVPFLGTFGCRPFAAAVDRITGIFNGTSNFVLSRVDEGLSFADALAEAQHKGFAEPDASQDVAGNDAAQKLAIVIRHFAGLSVRPAVIPRTSISGITPDDLTRARELGGRLKPIAFAEWWDTSVTCFAGPAFLSEDDPLAALRGVLSGIRIERTGSLPLHLTGPGAGPEITARTILDDVVEVLADRRIPAPIAVRAGRVLGPSSTGWFVTLRAAVLADPVDIADLFGAHGVWVRRWGAAHPQQGGAARSLLTFPCPANELEEAMRAIAAASGCATRAYPTVEAGRG